MNHWSVDEEKMKKDPESFAIWSLENAINFGISRGKLNKKELIKYWDRLDLDIHKRKFLSLLLQK